MTEVETRLRVAERTVAIRAPESLARAVVGPLIAFEEEGGAPGGDAIEVAVRADPAGADVAPASHGDAPVGFVVGKGRVDLFARGLGSASVPDAGPILVRLRTLDVVDDAAAEGLLIPALAERLRTEGIRLVHAAVLLAKDGGGCWLVPARRGGGKTTLALSLRGRGFVLLSDDRCFLSGRPEDARVSPWPEAPRVGERSLFLLPPGVALGRFDDRSKKYSVPALTPVQWGPTPLRGFLLPRLVEGRGGEARPATGAEALAAVASQGVVATRPGTAAASLAWFAALLARVPTFETTVGEDPEALARAVRALPP